MSAERVMEPFLSFDEMSFKTILGSINVLRILYITTQRKK